MKLNKNNKQEVLKVLSSINLIRTISNDVYRSVQKNSSDPNLEELSLDDCSGCLDIVYLLMLGDKESHVYNSFECPAYAKRSPHKAVAWYSSDRFPIKNYPKGPSKMGGFIPDCINNAIMNCDLMAAEQYKLLLRMFSDLIKLKNKKSKKVKK